MTSKSNAQNAARPVEPTEKPYATIYLSEELRRLKPGLIKTYAAIVGCSYVDKQTGQRISKATIRDIAQQGGISTDTARRNLAYLIDNTGLVSIGETETGRILMIETGDGPWVNLANDHPAWILSPLDFTVYLCLMRFNGPKGIIVSDATISELLFTSTKNVEKSMHALRGMGAIASTCWFKRTGSTVVKNRRVTIQSRTRWKISAADPVESEPQKVGDKYIIPTFCGTESEPQKVGEKYIIPTFCGTESEPQKVGDGAAKSRITLPQKVGIDIELRDVESDVHPQHAHAHAHARDGVGVGKSSPPSKPNQIDEALAKILKEDFRSDASADCDKGESFGSFWFNLDFYGKIRNDSDLNRIKNTVCKIWNECGPIKRGFIDEATSIEKTPEIKNMVGFIISRLNEWKTMDQAMRDEYSNDTSSEKRDEEKGISRLARKLIDNNVSFVKDEKGIPHFSVKEITQFRNGIGQIIRPENPLHEAMQDLEFESYARNSGDFRKNQHGEWEWVKETAIEKWTESAKKHLEKSKKKKVKK